MKKATINKTLKKVDQKRLGIDTFAFVLVHLNFISNYQDVKDLVDALNEYYYDGIQLDKDLWNYQEVAKLVISLKTQELENLNEYDYTQTKREINEIRKGL